MATNMFIVLVLTYIISGVLPFGQRVFDENSVHSEHAGIHSEHAGVHSEHAGVHPEHAGVHSEHTQRDR